MSREEPRGIGLYIRGLTPRKQGTPKQAAKKAKDNGITFVAIMSAWQDVHKGKERMLHSNGRDAELIKKYADAFAAQGIAVWIWGFPWGGREEAYVERMDHVTQVCDGVIHGWLHDPELGYKWKRGRRAKKIPPGMRGQPEFTGGHVNPKGSRGARQKEAAKLVELSIDCLDEDMGIGITSYGMAKGHPNFPWVEFGGVGWGSPQLYSPGPRDVDRGIRMWRERGWNTLLPSLPTFGKNSGAKLHDHISNFVDGDENVDGFIFWSWRQTQRDEWRILARWAEYFQRDNFPIG